MSSERCADFTPLFTQKNIFSSCCYVKQNVKNTEVYQNCYGERGVRSPGKRGNVTLIRPMSYKFKLLTDVVL